MSEVTMGVLVSGMRGSAWYQGISLLSGEAGEIRIGRHSKQYSRSRVLVHHSHTAHCHFSVD